MHADRIHGDGERVGRGRLVLPGHRHVRRREHPGGERPDGVHRHRLTRVGGNLEIRDTGQLFVFGSQIGGNLTARDVSATVQLCTSQVGGNARVQDSGVELLIGDPQAVDCAGNRIGGNVSVEDNFTDVYFVVRGNTIGGNLRVSDNAGPSEKLVQDNVGGGVVDSAGNGSPFVGTPNTFPLRRGQCAA